MDNDQIDNKLQDVQFKQSSVTEINSDGLKTETQHLQLIIDSNSPDISLDDYNKTISQISPVKINKDSIESPFELAQSDDTSNDIPPSKSQHQNNSSVKTNNKSSKHAHSPNEDDTPTNRQRSLSSSSSSSTDSSKSNDNQTSNIPYEILHNDEDDDDLPEHTNETTNQVSS